jgi:uncharacterized phage protein (TIGR02216 family)
MEIGLGKMGLSPRDFWDLSLQEFYAATSGFAQFHSGGKPPPLTRDELNDMMERYPD